MIDIEEDLRSDRVRALDQRFGRAQQLPGHEPGLRNHDEIGAGHDRSRERVLVEHAVSVGLDERSFIRPRRAYSRRMTSSESNSPRVLSTRTARS